MNDLSTDTSKNLEIFFEIEELDDLLKARSKLRSLDEKDMEKIRRILEKWENPQAVSNLLIHPSLIPEDIRISYLLKGLEERRNPYYILASIVGFQNIHTTGLSIEDIRKVKENLILTLKISSGVLSQRASVSIYKFLSSEDSPMMCELLSHPDDTTRHNILCSLIRNMNETDSESFILMANNSNIPEHRKKETVDKIQQYFKQKEKGKFSSLNTFLYTYVPNLKDQDLGTCLNAGNSC
jgi:succinate dehydrogenase flavin-adding protein (antitoxin of CptAB toxin-antitoxin module)